MAPKEHGGAVLCVVVFVCLFVLFLLLFWGWGKDIRVYVVPNGFSPREIREVFLTKGSCARDAETSLIIC